MSRTRRVVAVFLLALAVALPSAAMPAAGRTASWEGLLAGLRARLAPVFEWTGKSRSSMDPDGAPAASGEDPAASQAQDGDSRAGMDPNG
jgi:hypothetical protein